MLARLSLSLSLSLSFALAVALALPARLEAAPPLRIQLHPSRVAGLWGFSLALTGHWRGSTILRDLYTGSRFDTPAARQAIGELRALREAHFGHSFGFRGYPEGRREMSFDVLRHFDQQSARARDLTDLEGRTAGLLPAAEHRRLFELLAALAPAYDALVWRPSRAKLERQRVTMERVLTRSRLGELFERAARFYQSSWPARLPVTVALLPIPGASGHTHAVVEADASALEVLLDADEAPQRLAIVFHELCHSLFDAQPAAEQQRLERRFRQDPSPFAPLAYGLLNEALATALGNGLAYRRLTGKEDASPWYSDAQIDGFAHALSPRVRAYLEEGRALDAELVAFAIDAYRRRFPDAPYRYENLLKEVVVATDGETIGARAAGDLLRRHFRVPSMVRVSPMGGPDAARTLREAAPGTALLLVSSARHARQLEAVARTLPALKPALAALARAPGETIHASLVGGRPVILVRVSDAAGLARALEALKAEQLIRREQPLIKVPGPAQSH